TSTQRTPRLLALQRVPTVDELEAIANAVLSGALEGAVQRPDGCVLTSFDKIAEQFGQDQAKLRVMLHGLEREGVIDRGPDFTLEGTLLLNREPAEIAAKLAPEDRVTFQMLVQELELARDVRRQYRPLQFVSTDL